ncbi:uncharacterized protein LOC126809526 [Patella vulgata]|uniref:uncharacterized protein LOC126809526 n=1 Tax=Patella vulgata TaxID=6465 RepID=UPI00217F58EC|nr:uncharacterized protein LOC126809526 [Patella vulgata]
MDEVLTSIKNQDDGLNLWGTVEKLPMKDVIAWHDSNHFDFLHHAIIHNNVIAVGTFLTRGYFKSLQEPNIYPYQHVACLLGFKTILTMFLQERQFDDKILHKSYFKQLCRSLRISLSSETTNHNTDIHSTTRDQLSVLDVASLAGHIGCVKTILDFRQLKGYIGLKQRGDYFSLACYSNSPNSLKLLLQERAGDANLEDSVKISLVKMQVECLDCLLSHGVRTESLYGGMNLFHVLYSYVYAFEKEQFTSLAKMTSLILKYGFDVKACVPSRTYPLYSFIDKYFGPEDIEIKGNGILHCLKLLLEAGADPNFNEVIMENGIFGGAFGREPFSSAFHAFLSRYVQFSLKKGEETEYRGLPDFFFNMCQQLLQNGAGPNYRAIFGTPEQEISVFQAACLCSMNVENDNRIIKLFLQYGGDPNGSGFSIKSLLDWHITLNALEYETVELLNMLLCTMSHANYRQSIKEIMDSANMDIFLPNLVQSVNNESITVWTLKRFCCLFILNSCQRSSMKVNSLPVPENVKKQIFPFY